jgi:hypothetical protein
LVEVVLVFGASTVFFSSGISTRFTVFFGSDVAGLAAAGATVVFGAGVTVAVVALVVSPVFASVVVASASAFSASASASAISFSSSSSVDATCRLTGVPKR